LNETLSASPEAPGAKLSRTFFDLSSEFFNLSPELLLLLDKIFEGPLSTLFDCTSEPEAGAETSRSWIPDLLEDVPSTQV